MKNNLDRTRFYQSRSEFNSVLLKLPLNFQDILRKTSIRVLNYGVPKNFSSFWHYGAHLYRTASSVIRYSSQQTELTTVQLAFVHSIKKCPDKRVVRHLNELLVSLDFDSKLLDTWESNQDLKSIYISVVGAGNQSKTCANINLHMGSCAIVRLCDKLDNLEVLFQNPDFETKRIYLREIFEFGLPLSALVLPKVLSPLRRAALNQTRLLKRGV